MNNIFKNIEQSELNDPLRFFREIGKEHVLFESINKFMPLEIIIEDENGQEIRFFEPIAEYRNVDFTEFQFEIEEFDRDYRQEDANQPSEIKYWEKFSFRKELSIELEQQKKISETLILNNIYKDSTNPDSFINLVVNDIQIIKGKIAESSIHAKFPEINETLNLIYKKTIHEYVPLFQKETSSTEKKIKAKALPAPTQIQSPVRGKIKKITVSDFNTLHSKIAEFDKKFAIAEVDFRNAMIQICKNGIPNDKLYINFGNIKTFYFLLSKLKKSYEIDYKKLEGYIDINESPFDSINMDDYPSTANPHYKALISKWYEEIK